MKKSKREKMEQIEQPNQESIRTPKMKENYKDLGILSDHFKRTEMKEKAKNKK